MHAVQSKRRLRRGIQLGARVEKIDETNVQFLRDLLHGRGVLCETLIVLLAVGQIGHAMVFESDRREQNDPRCAAAIILLALEITYLLLQIGFELVWVVGERLVVAEEGENHVRFNVTQVFLARPPAVAAGAPHQPIAGVPHVPPSELHPLRLALHHGLDPAIVLHPVGEAVANHANRVAFLQFHRHCRAAQFFSGGWYFFAQRIDFQKRRVNAFAHLPKGEA